MSDAESAETKRDTLEAAIEENPEAVAEFVERLDTVNELLTVLELGEDALDDEMLVELSDTGSTLAESADGLATDGTVDLATAVGSHGEELADALETLAALQESGTLDELVELAELASLVTDALDDEMVTSLAETGSSVGELAESAAEPDTRRGIERTLAGIGAAERTDAEPVGMVGLLRALRNPDVRAGLGYVIAIAEGLGQSRTRGEKT
jgi:uncharacterized protein YjgD (DUF1641 family)